MHWTTLLIALAALFVCDAEAEAFGRHRRRCCCVSYAAVPVAPAPSLQAFISPSGRSYRFHDVLKSNPSEGLERLEFRMMRDDARARDDERFGGSWRKAAKTSLSSASPEDPYERLKDLLDTFPSDSSMREDHDPAITSSSERVEEEERNVVVECWLLGASREDDNDYHLIVGDRRDETNANRMMTAEISGLPASGPFRDILRQPRQQYKDFFGSAPPTSFRVFDDPIKVRITGSVFFDKQHRPGGVGHGIYKPNYSWEVHPVRKIEFFE